MKLSCTNAILPQKTLTDKAHYLKKIGYDGIAVFTTPEEWNDKLMNELEGLEKATGVKPCEFVFMGETYGHLMDKDKKIQRQAIDLYKESIAVCNRIGAITEMEYEYRYQNPLPLFEPYQVMPAEEQEIFVSIIREFSAALGNGAWMLIEGCNRYEEKYLNRLSDCKQMIDKANVPHIGLLADFFHMAIEEEDLAASIRACGSQIRHVHLGDSNRLGPGHGHTDWKAGMKALKEIGFSGFMNLECGLGNDVEAELVRIRQFFTNLEKQL
jgi:sugar phosphate isomerase/epimerase